MQQKYIYSREELEDVDSVDIYVNCQIPFPVKQVKFNFAYSTEAVGNIFFIVKCDLVNGDIVGTLNKYAYADDNDHSWFIERLKQTNVFSYIFREPRAVNGDVNFEFRNLGSGHPINNNVLIQIEFLGD